MTAKELRKIFLDFFKSQGHSIIPSASLIPENDPTVLFTTAGMHPLVPYLIGEKHPEGNKLASCQKCIRTSDIDEVGDETHLTFFEMLGNWSLGDSKAPDGIGTGYFKEKAIKMSYEFLTSKKYLGLDKKYLSVSVFAGNENVEFDKESYDIWKSLGFSKKRIAKLSQKSNWWGPAGQTGPCGPCTEIFYWAGDSHSIPDKFDTDNDNWIEIWNNVFMEFNKVKQGNDYKFSLLKQKNVDTGMGLERVLFILNKVNDIYKTDVFSNLIFKIEQLSKKKYNESPEITKSMRIIADHLKAVSFILGDDKGIAPSNIDQGYIVRRLIRRALRYGKQLGISYEPWTKEVAKIVIHDYLEQYPELQRNADLIISQLKVEESKFKKTLSIGLKKFKKIIKNKSDNLISGKEAFNLYQTYGFPIEMTEELAKENNLIVDKENYFKEAKKHQKLSRTASVGRFKGGLSDAKEETIRLHTAAHLLLAALRQILGNNVFQKGSNITKERLRFDFSYPEKLTQEQKEKVEDLVNKAVKDDLTVKMEEMTLKKAKENKALGVFDSKYKNKVKVYTIGKGDYIFSKEICGGPHAKHTVELGHFKIIKEQSSSAGVRRIKAILIPFKSKGAGYEPEPASEAKK